MAALSHRGPDGWRVERHPWIALGHQHFWTTPEELGERQPVSGEGGAWIALDGRLDNRADLARALGIGGVAARASDAALVVAAYERWGTDAFARLLGPFSLAIFDARRHRLVLARDPLGSRVLFYHLDPRLLVAASEEAAVAAHPAVGDEVDQVRMREFLAAQPASDGRTFFAGVRELPPATCLVVSESSVRETRFWQPPAEGRGSMSEADSAERFRELLAESVDCRLRGAARPAVLMSGGLDSTSVAALAAERLAVDGRRLHTVSWVFDRLASCDERRYIEPVRRRLGAGSRQLPGDGAWTLRHLDRWGLNPNTPEENPYRLLKQEAYGAAAAGGSRVLLTGGFGDSLFVGSAWWLAGLLRAGRPLAAAGELLAELGRNPQRAAGGLRRALALPRLRRPRPPAWLTSRALARLGPARATAARHEVEQRRSLLGWWATRDATLEIFHANRAGVELRHPFRDRRLVEFVLSLAPHHLYRHGRKKHLLRVAMRDRLPCELLARCQPTSLAPVFRRGVFEREAVTAERLVAAARPWWLGEVRPDWLSQALAGGAAGGGLALWHCLAAGAWQRAAGVIGRSRRRATA